MAAKRNVPQLRFPGFTDDWEQRKLGDIAEIKTGPFGTQLNAKEYTIEGVPVINVKNIGNGNVRIVDLDYVSEVTASRLKEHRIKENDIVFGRKGAIGRHTIIRKPEDGWLQGSDCIRVRFDKGVDALYVNATLQTKHVLDYLSANAYGSTMLTLTTDMIAGIPCFMPENAEQAKIAQLIDNIDNLITLHQRNLDAVRQYKMGMLQKMFPRDREKVPKVRFPGFTGDWEQRKLGDICQRVVRKNKNAESDLPLTISSQDGLIDQRNFFGKVIAAKDMSNYYLLKNGEFAYNKSYSRGYDYGSIKRLNAYEQGCLSTLYICFALSDTTVDTDYLEHYFDTLLWYKNIAQICAEGARNHGLLNVDTKAFFNSTIINIPSSLDEQKKIASFLDALDRAISLHQQRVDQIKLYKQGLLQQMFV